MADAQTFRDLSARFIALGQSHDPSGELHALYSDKAPAPPRDPAECEMALQSHARDRVQAYSIGGGPAHHRESLLNQWTALAVLGASEAGSSGTAEDMRIAWLDLIRTRTGRYRPMPGSSVIDGEHFSDDGGRIECLCIAAAELCLILEGDSAVTTALSRDRNNNQEHDLASVDVPLKATITSAVIRKRKRLLKKYRHQNAMTAADFARRVGYDAGVVYNVVKEDRVRGFSDAARDAVLEMINVCVDEWYRA